MVVGKRLLLRSLLLPTITKLPAVSADISVRVTKGDMVASVYGTRSRWLWPYTAHVHNRSASRIQLKGRRLEIKGTITEHVPFQKDAFASSVGGEQRILEPGETWSYDAAVVTDDLKPPFVKGSFDGVDLDQQARVLVELPPFVFDAVANPLEETGDQLLSGEDPKLLCEAIELYEFARHSGYGALFRPDRIKLTNEGCSLINRYLIDYFRQNRGKSIEVDFSPLLSKSYREQPRTLRVLDHYFLSSERSAKTLNLSYVLTYNYWELTKKKPADAGLPRKIAEIRSEYGFDEAMKELLRTASPEERARVSGMVAADFRSAAVENETPQQLSDADRRAFIAHSKKHPWAGTHEGAPSAFIAGTFDAWLGRGLSLRDIRNAQPKLAASYSTEVSRDASKRLPNLYVKPHKLPAGAPPRLRPDRRVSELSEEQLLRIRQRDRDRKSRSRPHQPKQT